MISKILAVAAIARAVWPHLGKLAKEVKQMLAAARDAAEDGKITNEEWRRISDEAGDAVLAIGDAVDTVIVTYLANISHGSIKL